MRQSWTDERLDDLNGKVDRIDQKVDQGFDRIDQKVDQGFDRLDQKVDQGFDRLDGRIDSLGGRIDSLVRAAMIVGAGLFAAFLGFLATVLGMIITQL